ncbi:hypothetical protein GN244_ATG01576 [Phytophthora infestans]|uniref:Uncharacterized protein n=1 Tax=Phytophthora infestans TaxID=4787 RepID=A0A833SCY8_PHYIN|nr:hypothetical protein GN244_ATG01576 [Phytophthora infestans]
MVCQSSGSDERHDHGDPSAATLFSSVLTLLPPISVQQTESAAATHAVLPELLCPERCKDQLTTGSTSKMPKATSPPRSTNSSPLRSSLKICRTRVPKASILVR